MTHPQPLDTLWQTLVNAALLGTSRQSFSLPQTDGALGEFLLRIESKDTEELVLRAASAVSLYRQAGRLPTVTVISPPALAEPETLPRCSERAQFFLTQMLSGNHAIVLPEFLQVLAKKQQRVPEENLAALLELARTQSNLALLLPPVFGARGKWLAAQNPDWSFVSTPKNDESVWETGSRDERRAYIQRLRAENPTRARELVSAAWKEDTPQDRAFFLETFRVGLSVDDEPFLENALDDRRKEVRTVAAELLMQLAASQLVQRMRARVTPLLNYKRKFLGGDTLKVTLPEECDKAMQRDGIEPQPPQTNIGKKAWWLLQMLGAIPPATWTELWQQKPTALIQAALKTEWHDALLQGWARAARNFNDLEWAEALIEQAVFKSGNNQDVTTNAVIPILVTMLPVDHFETLSLRALMASGNQFSKHPVLIALQYSTHPWSLELTRTVWKKLLEFIKTQTVGDFPLWVPLQQQLPLLMHPAVAPEMENELPTTVPMWVTWRSTLEKTISLVRFRSQMLDAIAKG